MSKPYASAQLLHDQAAAPLSLPRLSRPSFAGKLISAWIDWADQLHAADTASCISWEAARAFDGRCSGRLEVVMGIGCFLRHPDVAAGGGNVLAKNGEPKSTGASAPQHHGRHQPTLTPLYVKLHHISRGRSPTLIAPMASQPPPPPQWVLDLNSTPASKPKSSFPDPPGYTAPLSAKQRAQSSKATTTRQQPTTEEMDTLKMKKAWELAIAPAKQLPMNAIGEF